MINIGVIGCGYWGPNLIRNFEACPETRVLRVCDIDPEQLKKTKSQYGHIKDSRDFNEIIQDMDVEAVAIATPVHTHYNLAKACLENGKHVLIEKPMAGSVEEGEKLVELAQQKGLNLMCDHTFCYTSAVRKMKEIIDSGVLGEILYFDSVRINLGLFQHDINVIWDLAPHDLSILDFLIRDKPVSISALGVCHSGNSLENMAYVTLRYSKNFMAHFHLSWLSPVKIRKTIIGGSDKMIVWNDLEQAEKIRIYDKGITVQQKEQEEIRQLLVSYRHGDMRAPMLENSEALYSVVQEFTGSINENRPPKTPGEDGLHILKILEAAESSLKSDGANTRIIY